jgi:hypothetical protein
MSAASFQDRSAARARPAGVRAAREDTVRVTVGAPLSHALTAAHVQVSSRARGQGLLEYALIISFISLFCIVSLVLFGTSFASLLGNTQGGVTFCIQSASSCTPPPP